jgi:hypothetical protein
LKISQICYTSAAVELFHHSLIVVREKNTVIFLLPFQLYDGMRFPKDNNALYAFAVWLFLAMLYLSSIPKDNNTLYAFVVIPSQFSGAWLRNQS